MAESSANLGEDEHPALDLAPRLVPAPHVMDAELKPWELHSLNGAEGPETLDAMKRYFKRYRAARSKTANHAYSHDALQRSWCAFTAAGTRREGTSFTSWLEAREERHSEHSIGDLRSRICSLAQEEWRLCYVHLREGCSRCAAVQERPTQAEWDHQVRIWTLKDHERSWIGRYERALSELRRAELCRARERSRSRDRSRDRTHRDYPKRSRSPKHSRSRRRSRSRSQSRNRRGDLRGGSDAHARERSRSLGREREQSYRERTPAQAWPRTPPPCPGYHSSSGYGAPTYPPLASNPASGPGNASRSREPEWTPTQHQSREAYAYHDPQYAQRPSAERPTRLSAEADRRDERGSASATVEAPRGSEAELHSERLTVEQYRLMRVEAEQATNDVLDVQELAQGARDDANAATAAAEKARREQRDLVEHLRRLETAVFGAPQPNELRRAQMGLGPSRRQRRRMGISDYAPARGDADGGRGCPPGGTA